MNYIYCNGKRNYGPFASREEAQEWGGSFNGQCPDDSRVTSCTPYTFELSKHGGWFVEFGA
jgi:hypothetical protein